MKIILALIILSLSGCTDLISYKDARNLKTTKIITTAPESEEVVVADLRGTFVEVEEDVKDRKDWNSPKETKTDRANATEQRVQPVNEVHKVETQSKDMSNELYWFFFSMMLMGMLGAGLIGIIEAVAENRKKK